MPLSFTFGHGVCTQPDFCMTTQQPFAPDSFIYEPSLPLSCPEESFCHIPKNECVISLACRVLARYFLGVPQHFSTQRIKKPFQRQVDSDTSPQMNGKGYGSCSSFS